MTQKIGLYTKNMNGVWFGVACDDEQVFATTFTNSEKSAMKSLTEAIPQSMEFQVCAEPSILAEKVLRSAKSVYDGKGETESVPLATNNLPLHKACSRSGSAYSGWLCNFLRSTFKNGWR